MEGGGGGKKGKRLPVNNFVPRVLSYPAYRARERGRSVGPWERGPMILENALDISRFGSSVN